MFQIILIAAIVVLLLVVFIPIGVALYNKAKNVRPAVQQPQQGQPPASNLPPTLKMPALNPPNAAPASSPTMLIPLEPAVDQPQPGGTEMITWNGMLQCTAGPLAGQHFIIEEGGLYIGRDAALSNIVIDDARISKRHVRILPRNGKVYAIDQGSTNGTFLDSPGGERITEVQLKRGDKLVLADNAATFVYQI